MSDVAIQVENLGKLYRLGEIGTGTLSHDLNRAWARLRGKEDPFAKIGETNDRTSKGSSDFVWSLKDVSFDVKQGEVLGIIGRNGAGKSTLLKILSKVTAPTTGRIKIKGRIASLLEVGTGFHPELTGRENIFLNGAILGMTKAEIRSKFDEIVDFSGVERYIDTPVKRYSSGMYVRLAFAVAAFLEPEILIVDEVLAVGDAEFQKKCLGRMKDVSVNDGRTVLFVSHNLAAVNTLCTQGIILRTGQTDFVGPATAAVERYINTDVNPLAQRIWEPETAPSSEAVRILAARTISEGNITSDPAIDKELEFEFEFEVLQNDLLLYSNIQVISQEGICVLSSVNWPSATPHPDPWSLRRYSCNLYRASCVIPANYLNEGTFSINFLILGENAKVHLKVDEILFFTVHDTGHMRGEFLGSWAGITRPKLSWQTQMLK